MVFIWIHIYIYCHQQMPRILYHWMSTRIPIWTWFCYFVHTLASLSGALLLNFKSHTHEHFSKGMRVKEIGIDTPPHKHTRARARSSHTEYRTKTAESTTTVSRASLPHIKLHTEISFTTALRRRKKHHTEKKMKMASLVCQLVYSLYIFCMYVYIGATSKI